jgi:hypothetical protein
MKRANAHARIYGSAEEQRIIANNLARLEDEINLS